MQATVAAPPSASKPALVPAVARALALLDLLEKERGAMSLAKLAASLALPKSSVHGLCNTLTALGYLRRQDDGTFYIGPRVMGLALTAPGWGTPGLGWRIRLGLAAMVTMVVAPSAGMASDRRSSARPWRCSRRSPAPRVFATRPSPSISGASVI